VLERTSQIAYLTQTSNHVITRIYYTAIIIHRQRSLTIVINRTRKDSCENAHVLLLVVRQSRCTVKRSECGVGLHWYGHVLRLNAH